VGKESDTKNELFTSVRSDLNVKLNGGIKSSWSIFTR
jgi:hypothetical protein